jgi:hypothetical protein
MYGRLSTETIRKMAIAKAPARGDLRHRGR